jgi:glycosyltransferase involved in cell wall biosynthesis
MSRNILVVHYTPPGVVGGVEHIIQQHARLLGERGYEVSVVAGRAGETDVPVTVVPEIDVATADNIALEEQLAAGVVGPDFWRARDSVLRQLQTLAARADWIIAHNAFTLHFSLPLTSALWDLAGTTGRGRFIAWTHDLSWINPLYRPHMHTGFPWDLLATPAPGVHYVTVSAERRAELQRLWERTENTDVSLIPNGIDVRAALRLSPESVEIAERYRLFRRDAVLLLPVRITRRKNIEVGIRALRCLVERGLDAAFLISGPEAPHHPGRSRSYLSELQALARELGLSDRVIFLSADRGANLPSDVIPELYALADVLLFPSASEGFGLPILEAGLARVPIVLSDIPIFAEIGGDDVLRFDPQSSADTIAAMIVEALSGRQSRLYRRVLLDYSWEKIVDDRLVPLLGGGSPGETEGGR